MDMSGMNHGSGSEPTEAACKISMLWNWYTVDSCFISKQWHVRSVGGFVGTVLGVFLIVVALEAVRRLGREYDRSIKSQFYASLTQINAVPGDSGSKDDPILAPFRPTFAQHAVRSAFYCVQFSTSYLLMLMAMYYNGYVLFAIFLGGGVGYLLCARDTGGDFRETPESRGECCC